MGPWVVQSCSNGIRPRGLGPARGQRGNFQVMFDARGAREELEGADCLVLPGQALNLLAVAIHPPRAHHLRLTEGSGGGNKEGQPHGWGMGTGSLGPRPPGSSTAYRAQVPSITLRLKPPTSNSMSLLAHSSWIPGGRLWHTMQRRSESARHDIGKAPEASSMSLGDSPGPPGPAEPRT
jgi:hypothetical protein